MARPIERSLQAPSTNRQIVWRYLRPTSGSLGLALLLAALLALVSAGVAALVGPAIQIITSPKDHPLAYADLLGPRLGALLADLLGSPATTAGTLLGQLPPLLVVLALAKAALSLTQWFLWERAGELASRTIRDDLATGYLGLDPHIRRDEGARAMEAALSTAVTTDVKLMREYVVHFYGGLPRELLQVGFLGATLVLLSPKLTALFLMGVAPAAVVVSRVGKKLRRRASRALADYSDLSEWLQQRLLGIETIKHYRTEALEARSLERLTANLLQRFLKAARVKARTSPLLEILAVAAMVVVLVVALGDVAAGRVSGAVQLSFFSTLALLSQAAGKLGRYVNSNREGAAAVDRLRAQLDFQAHHQVERPSPPVVTAAQGGCRIVCEGLTAHYAGADAPALADFSQVFEGGRIYCLAGPSGAGKSTLFNLLLGLVKPTRGQVRLEVPSSWPSSTLPLCYMPQKVLLLPDSLAANVAYPASQWDEARVREALARVGLGQVAATLPQGLATRVGEGGTGVSGGQAQRILLARLWYHRTPLVLVDEGTSALDPEVERQVQTLLRELAASGSVVVTIAHRPSVMAAADIVLRLEKGRLSHVDVPPQP